MNKERLDELIDAWRDNDLSDEQAEELNALLRESEDARRTFAADARMHGLLHCAVAEEAVERVAAGPTPGQSRTPWSGIAIAAAATILVLVGWLDRSAPEPDSPVAPDSFLALLVDEAGAEFADGKGPDEVRFEKGSYQLQHGAVHMRFANGADVMMNAPASFDIRDGFHVQLHHGDMRAIVPPSGHGFTIATLGVVYEDRGTEFAISIDPSKGVNKLHVVDGQVDAKDPVSKELISSVTEGQSVQFADGNLGKADTPDLSRYPTPGSIGLLGWQQQRASFSNNDADLIAYYPFVESEQLRNEAANPIAGDGDIHGARWVTGRWPGKHALLFDRDTDFVELDVPGEYQELSFAAWVKLDRFDHNHNSVFNSNSWDMGDVHWTIHRHGAMGIDYRGSNTTTQPPPKTIPTDQWIHLAATLSRESKKSCVYLNGELAGTRQFDPNSTAIRPGLGRIGNWLEGDRVDLAPERALRGKMDELAIWKRALTEEEVKELATKGRPTTLWPMANRFADPN